MHSLDARWPEPNRHFSPQSASVANLSALLNLQHSLDGWLLMTLGRPSATGAYLVRSTESTTPR